MRGKSTGTIYALLVRHYRSKDNGVAIHRPFKKQRFWTTKYPQWYIMSFDIRRNSRTNVGGRLTKATKQTPTTTKPSAPPPLGLIARSSFQPHSLSRSFFPSNTDLYTRAICITSWSPTPLVRP